MLLPFISVRSAESHSGLPFHTGSRITAAVLIGIAMLMSGCLQSGGSGSSGGSSSEPSTPEDYVYKGRVDPFLSVPSAERADALQKRFMQIQGRE